MTKEPFTPYVMIVSEYKFFKCTLPVDIYEQMKKLDVREFIDRFLAPAIIHGMQDMQNVVQLDDAPRTRPEPSDILCSRSGCTRAASFIVEREAYCVEHRPS
jgi:hypothetical protein